MPKLFKAVFTSAVVLLSVNAAAWANDVDECRSDYSPVSLRAAAIAACSRIIAKNKNDPFGYLQRAWAYEKQADLDHAIADLKEAVRLNRDQRFWTYDLKLCEVYGKKGDVTRGIEACSQLIGRNLELPSSDLSKAYSARAELYLKKGDRENAVPDLVRAFKLAPTGDREEVRGQLVSIVGEEKFPAIIGAPTTLVPVVGFFDEPKLPATEAKAPPIIPGSEPKAIQPDNKIAAVSPSDKPQLVQSGAAIDVVLQSGHQQQVSGLAVSSDGRRIVSGSFDGSIVLWDVDSGRELRSFTGTPGSVTSVAFSSDGQRIVSGQGAGSVRIWDVNSGRELRVFQGEYSSNSVAFSPDGRKIVSAGLVIKVWDVESGRELRTFNGHAGSIDSVVFSPDGRKIVSGSRDKTIKLWDIEGGRELRTFRGHAESVNSVVFSPDGRLVVSGSGDKTIKLWDVESGRELRTFSGHAESVNSAAISPDGRLIVSNSWHMIKLWDAENGRELRQYAYEGDVATKNTISFVRDGARFVSGNHDGSVKLWDAGRGQELRVFAGRSRRVTSIAISSDGRNVAFGNFDYTITLSDLQSPQGYRTFTGDSSPIDSVMFSQDGRFIVSRNQDGAAKLWDVQSGRELRTVAGVGNVVTRSIAVSPDGTQIIYALDKAIKMQDLKSGALRTFLGHADLVNSVAFSPDGQRIVSRSSDKTIKVWDARSARELRSFVTLDKGFGSPPVFSPDGRRVAGREGYDIKIWDADSGREMRTLKGHSAIITALAFGSDGKLLASAGIDNTIKLWDADNGYELRSFNGRSLVSVLAFSSDSRRLISGTRNEGVKLWDVNTGALIGTAMQFLDNEWLFLTSEGFFDASSPKAAQNLNVVRGLEVSSIDQVYNALYRPDLVREKLAGDPDGKVKAAAAKLDLNKVMASGSAPKVAITTPTAGTSSATDEVAVEATVSDQGGGIGKVEWRVNGVTSGIETRGLERVEAAAAAGRSVTVKRTLALERGENRIEVLAYNAKDLIASEPASVTVKWDGEKTATPPKLFVMAVGVNDYYDSRLRLSYAVPDATAIAEGFRKAGNGLYAAVDVTTVLDTDVTIANLDKVFTELGKKAQPRDVFVFFLAGHGKTKNGRYYFLPRDFRYEDEDSIEKAGMDQDKFQAWFAKIPARKSILLYDTCESGSLTGTKARGSDIDERLGALNRMTRATGRTFLTATTDDAPALEGYHGHGVFTYALLDALDHADVNKNGLIEVSELADYIDQKVPDFSFEAFKLRQIPQRSIVGNNFALTNKMAVLVSNNSASAKGGVADLLPGQSLIDGAIPMKPTHVVITSVPVEVFESIAANGTKGIAVQRLTIGTPVVVLKSANGWDLVATDGKSLGYVSHAGLAPVQ